MKDMPTKGITGGKGVIAVPVSKVYMPNSCDINRREKYDAMIARMKRRLEWEKKDVKSPYRKSIIILCYNKGCFVALVFYASGIRTIAHFNGYLNTFREILYDNEMWESWFRDLTRLRLKSLARERYQIARCRYYMVEFLRDEEDRDRL